MMKYIKDKPSFPDTTVPNPYSFLHAALYWYTTTTIVFYFIIIIRISINSYNFGFLIMWFQMLLQIQTNIFKAVC